VRRVAIFGSTGSVGQNAVRVVEALPQAFEVTVLAAFRSSADLARQAARLSPRCVVLGEALRAAELEAALPAGWRGDVAAGPEALAAAARRPDVDVVLNAITGAAGLPVSLAAVSSGKILALANKESMVAAGPLLVAEAARTGAAIVPVDSEHGALHQVLRAGRRDEVRELVLTASGGPFRRRAKESFAVITKEEALNHPTWRMGPKITVDSATLMNKALEVVEARWLFDVPADAIRVVIHPQSIVHSMVAFRDGSVIAQMGPPDMRIPIQYALSYPDRLPSALGPSRFDPRAFDGLTFEEPDLDRFPSLGLGFRAAKAGGLLGAVLNGANERAVDLFLRDEISFPEIFERVSDAMSAFHDPGPPTIDRILEADRWAREEVASPT
jgi:1-deoxy-D-xylulose-5-phosphate reductoisomerase